jgi:hypothetical protein
VLSARRIRLSALVALSSAALLGAPTASPAPAAQSKATWKLFGAAKVDQGRPLLGLGWAANRLWAIAPRGNVATLASARVSGKVLTGFAATRVPGGSSQYVPIVDGQLVLARDGGSATAALRSDGGLGPSRPIPDELLTRAKEAVPKLATVGILAGVHVGNRQVWALSGAPECHSIGGCAGFFLACCSVSDAATDLTRFIDRRVGVSSPQIGLDGRGRIWLAWLDRRDYSRAERGVPRMLELDGSTLAPQGTAGAAPGVIADKVVLACAATCRVVAQSAGGDIVSWAPGERSPTRVASHWERGKWGDEPAWLLSASYRSGRLAVAYYGNLGKTIYADKTVRNDVRLLLGDARGAGARVVGTTPATYGWPVGKLYPPFSDPVVYGMFVPGGFVALEHFRYGDAASPLIYAVIPFGR